jgi:hypothetical protein
MSLVLQSSGGGQITIQEPATASNFTATMPAATGEVMVSGNMPAFSAYTSANNTTFTASAFTKVTLDLEEFDTNSNFASSRFTPTVAGYYQVNGAISFSTSTGLMFTSIYKNGTRYKDGVWLLASATTQSLSVVSSVIYCNGSTDYIELYGYNGNASSVTNNNGGQTYSTYLNGVLVRSA